MSRSWGRLRCGFAGNSSWLMALTHPGTNHLTEAIIGAAMEVHREIKPGMLESSYAEALWIELSDQKIAFSAQPCLPVIYKGRKLRTYYRPDLIIENQVIVELKAVEKVHELHRAQVLTYLRHAGLKVGLLFNFNTIRLKDGIWRLSQ